MIAHFIEVWAFLAVTFLLGCAIGAFGYELLAQSGGAWLQLRIVDAVGDIVDRIKRRLGVNPAWREYQHIPVRTAPATRPPVSDTVFVEAVAAELEEHAREWDREPELDPESGFEPETELEPEVETPEFSEGGEEIDLDPGPTEKKGIQLSEIDSLIPMRPAYLNTPRKGVPDNLQRIRGIGRKNEKLLNQLGIFHFGQIAAWTPGEILWVGQYLAFPERVLRDDWIGQAVTLATGSDTGWTKSADRRRIRRSEAAIGGYVDDSGPVDGSNDDGEA
jgi:predicted flap endonuclease-1-like 5' DNA nuclease